jgi:hypothetical protein
VLSHDLCDEVLRNSEVFTNDRTAPGYAQIGYAPSYPVLEIISSFPAQGEGINRLDPPKHPGGASR